ncbi:AAA family ATPase, partial [Methylosinus sp. Sm6]|uniref:AAA family ATPase n=1 Tax=Methylosinus sp. Sm6 TaxID=2866948 RepID=UPI00351D4920
EISEPAEASNSDNTGWGDPAGEPTHLAEKPLNEWRRATREVRALAEQLGISMAEVCRRADVPQGTLSPWYAGNYNGNYPNTTARVRKWLDAEATRRAASLATLAEPAFVETATAREALNAIIYAQTAPAFVLITLGAGMGKSTVSRHVVATRPHAYRVVMRPSTGSVHSMLNVLATEIGVVERDPKKLAYTIGGKLKRNGRNTLVMVDEAQNLTEAAVNELRYYMDEYGCGIALLGNEEVSTRWGQTTPREGQAQLHRRIGMRIRRMTPRQADIDAYVDAWKIEDPEVRKLARAIGRKPGALGQIAESLKLAAIMASGAGRDITADDLRQAWANRGGEEMR